VSAYQAEFRCTACPRVTRSVHLAENHERITGHEVEEVEVPREH